MFAFFILLILGISCTQKTLFVDPNGDDSKNCSTVEWKCKTISHALTEVEKPYYNFTTDQITIKVLGSLSISGEVKTTFVGDITFEADGAAIFLTMQEGSKFNFDTGVKILSNFGIVDNTTTNGVIVSIATGGEINGGSIYLDKSGISVPKVDGVTITVSTTFSQTILVPYFKDGKILGGTTAKSYFGNGAMTFEGVEFDLPLSFTELTNDVYFKTCKFADILSLNFGKFSFLGGEVTAVPKTSFIDASNKAVVLIHGGLDIVGKTATSNLVKVGGNAEVVITGSKFDTNVVTETLFYAGANSTLVLVQCEIGSNTVPKVFDFENSANVTVLNTVFKDADTLDSFLKCQSDKAFNAVLEGITIEPYIKKIDCSATCKINGGTCDAFLDAHNQQHDHDKKKKKKNDVPWYAWGIPAIAVGSCCIVCYICLCCVGILIFLGGGAGATFFKMSQGGKGKDLYDNLDALDD